MVYHTRITKKKSSILYRQRLLDDFRLNIVDSNSTLPG